MGIEFKYFIRLSLELLCSGFLNVYFSIRLEINNAKYLGFSSLNLTLIGTNFSQLWEPGRSLLWDPPLSWERIPTFMQTGSDCPYRD